MTHYSPSLQITERVDSPIISRHTADMILSFEAIEAARYLEYLKPDGALITSTQEIDPMPVITGAAKYPSDILDQIAYLHKESDMTVILVSHSMEDIARYADRIIVMNKGEVMYNDEPAKVFTHYKELEKVGLAAPQVTYIMHDLKEKGFPVNTEVTTVEEAVGEIMTALEK